MRRRSPSTSWSTGPRCSRDEYHTRSWSRRAWRSPARGPAGRHHRRSCGHDGIGEVDRAVGLEALVALDAEQALTSFGHIRRHAGEWVRELAVRTSDADDAVTLAEEDAAVGQELERRAVRPARERRDRERGRACPEPARASVRATAAAAGSHRVRRYRPPAAALPAGGERFSFARRARDSSPDRPHQRRAHEQSSELPEFPYTDAC